MTKPADKSLPFSRLPEASGLYDPRFEHDACGVSFVVDMKGGKSHEIVATALGALCNLDHRGAQGAEHNTGDGAGILVQVPDRFLREAVDFDLPPAGQYGVGLAFVPREPVAAAETLAGVEAIVREEGLRILGWRACIGRSGTAPSRPSSTFTGERGTTATGPTTPRWIRRWPPAAS